MARPVIASAEGNLERKSKTRLRDVLHPWTVTAFDQGDDLGRDVVIQPIEEHESIATASKHFFAAQLKATAAPFASVHSLSVPSRHLELWLGPPPIWVFAYSEADDLFRVRSASDLGREADQQSPGWRDQEKVTIRFPEESTLTMRMTKVDLYRLVRDGLDQQGGLQGFHEARRRVVLTDLFHVGTHTTSRVLQADGEDGRKITLISGPGWTDGDLDADDVFAPRVLAGAFLLYEEIWVSVGILEVVAAVAGSTLLREMVETGRLVPFAVDRPIMFWHERNARAGRLDIMQIARGPADFRAQTIQDYARWGVTPDLVDLIIARTRQLPAALNDSVLAQVNLDLENQRIRRLLGLSEFRAGELEPSVV